MKLEQLEKIYKEILALSDCGCKTTKDPIFCQLYDIVARELKRVQKLKENVRQGKHISREEQERLEETLGTIVHLYIVGSVVSKSLAKQSDTSKQENKDTDPLEGLRLPENLKEELEEILRSIRLKAYVRTPALILYLILLYTLLFLSTKTFLDKLLNQQTLSNVVVDRLVEILGLEDIDLVRTGLLSLLLSMIAYLTTGKALAILKHDLEILRVKLLKQKNAQIDYDTLLRFVKHMKQAIC